MWGPPASAPGAPGGRHQDAGVSEPNPPPGGESGPAGVFTVRSKQVWFLPWFQYTRPTITPTGAARSRRGPVPTPTPRWVPGKGMELSPRGTPAQVGVHLPRWAGTCWGSDLSWRAAWGPVLCPQPPRLPWPHIPTCPAVRPGSGHCGWEKWCPGHMAGGTKAQWMRVLWLL